MRNDTTFREEQCIYCIYQYNKLIALWVANERTVNTATFTRVLLRLIKMIILPFNLALFIVSTMTSSMFAADHQNKQELVLSFVY